MITSKYEEKKRDKFKKITVQKMPYNLTRSEKNEGVIIFFV